MGDMSKKLGELWKEVSSEEKKQYEVYRAPLLILGMPLTGEGLSRQGVTEYQGLVLPSMRSGFF